MILALDTSTSRLSLALWENGRILGSEENQGGRRQDEVILSALQSLLDRVRRGPAEIRGVAVGLGPGSFTGVRVGLSTGLGMAQSLGAPVAGVSSFAAVAAGSPHPTTLVLGDAGRGSVYAAVYRQCGQSWQALLPERLTTLAELVPMLPAGQMGVGGPEAGILFSSLERLHPHPLTLLEERERFPRAEFILPLALPMLAAGGAAWGSLAPIYLRPTQAEENRAAGALCRLRSMTRDDLPAVSRLEAAASRPVWSRELLAGEFADPNRAHYLVAEIGTGEIVGFGGFWLVEQEAQITKLAVHPGQRRKKIGARLLSGLLAEAVRLGARRATLEVSAGNAPALALYEKFGFARLALRRGYYPPLEGDNGDAWVMMREKLEESTIHAEGFQEPR